MPGGVIAFGQWTPLARVLVMLFMRVQHISTVHFLEMVGFFCIHAHGKPSGVYSLCSVGAAAFG